MFARLKLFLTAALMGLNASFVATKYSRLTVRKTRLDQLISEGNTHARLLRQVLGDMGRVSNRVVRAFRLEPAGAKSRLQEVVA